MLRLSAMLLTIGTAAVLTSSGLSAKSAAECGKASWYDELAGAHGGLAAAHPSLPFGTRVLVENLDNGRTATLVINDRGPFTGGRVIDVTREAAEQLDFVEAGIARVRISSGDGATASCQ